MYYYNDKTKEVMTQAQATICESCKVIAIRNLPEFDKYTETIYIESVYEVDTGYEADVTVVQLPDIVRIQNYIKMKDIAYKSIDNFIVCTIYEGFDFSVPIDGIMTSVHFNYDQLDQININDNIALMIIDSEILKVETNVTMFGYVGYTGRGTGSLVKIELNQRQVMLMFMTAVTFKEQLMMKAQELKSNVEKCESARQIEAYLNELKIPY